MENGTRAGAGSLGTCTAFSLNGQKPFQSGEGGLLTTDDKDVHEAVVRFASLGEARPRILAPREVRESWARWLGDQLRLDEIKAALARSQLRRLDDYLVRARRNVARLAVGLSDLPGFKPPVIPDECESSHYRWRVRLDPSAYDWEGSPDEFRDRVLYALQMEGVPVDTWQLKPLPAHPVFRRKRVLPWSPGVPDDELLPWHADAYPIASALLASSITVGAHPHPLHVQSEQAMRACVDAFRKVVANIATVLTASYEPLRPVPPILQTDL